jgi:hypothetical protein
MLVMDVSSAVQIERQPVIRQCSAFASLAGRTASRTSSSLEARGSGVLRGLSTERSTGYNAGFVFTGKRLDRLPEALQDLIVEFVANAEKMRAGKPTI